MFKVDEYIMYGVTGVCKVIDIKEEKLMNNVEKEYYVLNPIYSKDTVIKIPVDSTKISMRRIMSRDDIDSLINDMPNKETLWIDDEKERNEKYKSMLKSGDCEELITLMKSIYTNKKQKKTLGERSRKSDEELMKTAEKLLNEEFATVLDINIKDVKSYILSHVSE